MKTDKSVMCIHCRYYGMPIGTHQNEVTPKSERIKPAALAVAKLHASEGIIRSIGQSVGWLMVSQSKKKNSF